MKSAAVFAAALATASAFAPAKQAAKTTSLNAVSPRPLCIRHICRLI